MPGPGTLRAWLCAVQPGLAWTFSATSGAMMSATTVFASASTVSWPRLFELITRFAPSYAQPGDTTYQSGSALASSSLSSPRVFQGSRPMLFWTAKPAAQEGAPVPSSTVPGALDDSGQGS